MKHLLLLTIFFVPLYCEAAEVNYFGEFEKLYIHKLNPPEDNGLRLMIAACGPRILEQAALAESVLWEEMPTHEWGKHWFENQWKPLCEHLSIDPYKKPVFYDSLGYFGWSYFRNKDNENSGDPDGQILYNRLIAAPWKAEDHPDVAEWLKDRNAVLDYFGHCVRKPNYVSWRQPAETMYSILLPDVQAKRAFARDLRVRVTYRLGLGDVEGAWYDVMSMLTLARKHYKNDPISVIVLVGAAIEQQGYDAAKILVKRGDLTKEQLLRFAEELEALPHSNSFFDRMLTERSMVFDGLQWFNRDRKAIYELFDFKDHDIILKVGDKPINQEIARNRILKLHEECKPERITFEEMFANRLFRRQYFENLSNKVAEVKDALWKQSQEESNFTQEETFSQMVADWAFVTVTHDLVPMDRIYNNCDSWFVLLKIAMALELYKHDHGDYPATLESLLFEYLEEVPVDPSTSRATISYQKEAEKEGKKFLLYSYGPNQKDDGGKDDLADGDIVF